MDTPRTQPAAASRGGLWLTLRRRVLAASRCLGWRLVTFLVSSLVVLLGMTGWLALEAHRKHLLSLLEENAVGIGETILSSAHSSMLRNDRETLAELVANIGHRENVVALRLLGARGEIGFSSRPEEVGEILDVGAPLCQGCHAGEQVLAPATLRDGLQFIPRDGTLGLGMPVLNSPDCWNAACHVHPSDQRVLGMLDLELSTVALSGAMQEARRQMTGLGAITILLASATAGILAWRVAHRPLQTLLAGTRRLAGGDLAHRIPPLPLSEIGEVAASLNTMSTRLQHAQKELEGWNLRLEAKVAEKTRELENARDQMVFAEKMASLGKLAAVVAHEINNPLAGVLVYAKLVRRRLTERLESRPEDEESAQFQDLIRKLTTVESEIARCGDIVRNLLLFSRHRETTRAPSDLNDCVERALRLVQHQADLDGVTVRLDLDPDMPQVTCEPSQIQQAVLAVLMNGLEAMSEGGALDVATHHDPERGEASIEIRDTGVGIAKELQPMIFDPFFSTKTEGKGTGLGLSVMYGIVQRHEGRIDFDSSPGQGTSFRIVLLVHPKQRLQPVTDASVRGG